MSSGGPIGAIRLTRSRRFGIWNGSVSDLKRLVQAVDNFAQVERSKYERELLSSGRDVTILQQIRLDSYFPVVDVTSEHGQVTHSHSSKDFDLAVRPRDVRSVRISAGQPLDSKSWHIAVLFGQAVDSKLSDFFLSRRGAEISIAGYDRVIVDGQMSTISGEMKHGVASYWWMRSWLSWVFVSNITAFGLDSLVTYFIGNYDDAVGSLAVPLTILIFLAAYGAVRLMMLGAFPLFELRSDGGSPRAIRLVSFVLGALTFAASIASFGPLVLGS